MNKFSKDSVGSAALIVSAFISIAAGVFSNDASAKSPTPTAKPIQLETMVISAKRVK